VNFDVTIGEQIVIKLKNFNKQENSLIINKQAIKVFEKWTETDATCI